MGRYGKFYGYMYDSSYSNSSKAGIVIAQEAGALVNTSDLKLSGGEVTGNAVLE